MREGENTAGGCGVRPLIWFLSCADTEVAKTLRSRCESVINRDIGHIGWQPRYRGWQGVACRAEGRGTSRRIGPSIATVCDVSEIARLRKFKGVIHEDGNRDRTPQA